MDNKCSCYMCRQTMKIDQSVAVEKLNQVEQVRTLKKILSNSVDTILMFPEGVCWAGRCWSKVEPGEAGDGVWGSNEVTM